MYKIVKPKRYLRYQMVQDFLHGQYWPAGGVVFDLSERKGQKERAIEILKINEHFAQKEHAPIILYIFTYR